MKLSPGVDFTNPLAQSANVPAPRVGGINFTKKTVPNLTSKEN